MTVVVRKDYCILSDRIQQETWTDLVTAILGRFCCTIFTRIQQNIGADLVMAQPCGQSIRASVGGLDIRILQEGLQQPIVSQLSLHHIQHNCALQLCFLCKGFQVQVPAAYKSGDKCRNNKQAMLLVDVHIR